MGNKQKAISERQKAKGKRRKAKGNKQKAISKRRKAKGKKQKANKAVGTEGQTAVESNQEIFNVLRSTLTFTNHH